MRPKNPINTLAAAYGWMALVLFGLAVFTGVPGHSSPAIAEPSRQQALISQYCVVCHNQKLKSGAVSLVGLDLSDTAHNSAILEKVLRKVHSGEMPPTGMPRPDAAVTKGFTDWLEIELDRSAAAHLNPGRPTIHRLNRAEYSNAVRDLLALDIAPGAKLPPDDTGYGFDNIGDVLSMSPMLIERYMSVARIVSRLAVGNTAIKPEVAEFRPPKNIGRPRRSERVSDDLPFDSAGGLSVAYRFPVDGQYVIKIKLAPKPNFDGPQEPRIFELRLPVKPGTRTLGVTFPRQDALPETIAKSSGSSIPAAIVPAKLLQPGPPGLTTFVDLRLDGVRLKTFEVEEATTPKLASVTIAGPYNVTGPGDTPSREAIFVCKPGASDEEERCAKKIISSLAYRAFRRPVSDLDLKPLMAFYEQGRRVGSFDNGIEAALRAVLVSPDFLFRIEREPAGLAPGSVYRVNDFELASRLSFFLWSSIPDEPLLNAAKQAKLKDPAVLSQQVSRMLDDPRAKSLINNFAGQWLYLRNLEQVRPDPDEFPDFDSSLRYSFQRETELFFTEILRSNRPVTDLLDSNFTFVNQRLAEHYGIPDIYGSQFRRISLKDPNRGGLLGQGSILTVTSYPNRTSVVQRGKWILENLLGTPPPPPPPDVPDLKPHGKDGSVLTMREQMELHRSNSTCASCHSRMDPLGFALENYNGIGKWRTKDAGRLIDASGKLPDGTKFEGLPGLKKLLLTSHRDEFVGTVTEKLLTYALGRGLESYDRPAVRSIMREAAQDNDSFAALINAIVRSTPFQLRRTPES